MIFAPRRGKRPHDVGQTAEERPRDLPRRDPDCPFCPGNEKKLEAILLQTPETGDWLTRVVPNKFPALAANASPERYSEEDFYTAMTAAGRHEVVIESPRHDLDLSGLSRDQTRQVIETYHRRYLELRDDDRLQMILIFRNHGPQAGTSLIHPHSQIIATPIVPGYIRAREEAAERHYDDTGNCVWCEVMEFEERNESRLVAANGSFVAFVPYAAEVSHEVWIVPRRHEADFGDVTGKEKSELATILRDILSRLSRRLGDPDYNYIINTCSRWKRGEPQVHWYLQIKPRTSIPAGFEIGSGIMINPTLPEEDAAGLRSE